MSAELVRIFVLLVVFAAIFLLSTVFLDEWQKRWTHSRAVNKRLDMIGTGANRDAIVGDLIKNRPTDVGFLPSIFRRPVDWFQKLVFASGVNASFGVVLLLLAIAPIVVFVVTLVIVATVGIPITFGAIQLIILFAVALGVMVPVLSLQRMAQVKRQQMEKQFPVALDIFVRALRTGHPVSSAIDLLTQEMSDPIGTEFGLISDEIAYGADLIDALTAMADRWDLDDIRMFVVSLSLQAQTGGNLAEILENISTVIRERAQLFMKVRALSSEGRMTGWMLTVLPVVAFLMIFIATPQYYFNVADDPIFVIGASVLLVMYLIGVLVIRKMIDLKV